MVNNTPGTTRHRLERTGSLVTAYCGVVVATVVALAVLSALGSAEATSEAWGHAVVVAVFAVLLPLRLRAARRGSEQARRAVGIIAVVLAVVNLVEAALPGVFPPWMRVEMVAVAALMVAIALSAARERA